MVSNAADDPHRFNPDVHYRLYVEHRNNQVGVICVQDFDYPDYDARRFLSSEAYTTQDDAEDALADLLPAVATAEQQLPASLDPDMRGRMLAAAVRRTQADDQR